MKPLCAGSKCLPSRSNLSFKVQLKFSLSSSTTMTRSNTISTSICAAADVCNPAPTWKILQKPFNLCQADRFPHPISKCQFRLHHLAAAGPTKSRSTSLSRHNSTRVRAPCKFNLSLPAPTPDSSWPLKSYLRSPINLQTDATRIPHRSKAQVGDSINIYIYIVQPGFYLKYIYEK